MLVGGMVSFAWLTFGSEHIAVAESNRDTPIVQAIRRAEPAVVNIQGNKTVTSTTANGGVAKQEVNGMGTGVIIDSRGYIITNLHVVEDVAKIEVTLADGTSSYAKLINYDPDTDLALIKIPAAKDLPTIHFGSSADLLRGETVIAIGNPFGYQNTVTVGIISALHRDIPVNGSQPYKDLIQTNADINPGNSGGPLLNIDGDVIGINVAVRVGAQGIGFAIPIDTAMEVMADLVAASHRDPVQHGLDLASARSDDRTAVVVRAISNESISSRDIRAGDIIATIAGKPVKNRLELELTLLDHKAGENIDIRLERDGTLVDHSLTLKSSGGALTSNDVGRLAWEQLGVRLVPVPSSAVAGVGEEYKGGLKITEVRSGSPADKERLVAGDIIVGVMDWQTPNLSSLAWIMANQSFKSSGTAKYYLIRKRRPMTVAMSADAPVYR